MTRPKMTRPRTLLSTAIAALLVAIPAAAALPDGAPIGQYDYFDLESTTILDAKTGLLWDRPSLAPDARSRSAAEIWCDSNFDSASGAGGGRLPTIKELLTLLSEQPTNVWSSGGELVPSMIDRDAFPVTPNDAAYWSSTPTGDGEEVWSLSFSTGEMKRARPEDNLRFRCVR